MDRHAKHTELGITATSLLQQHLENPHLWDPTRIVESLFDKFEELDLEVEPDELPIPSEKKMNIKKPTASTVDSPSIVARNEYF